MIELKQINKIYQKEGSPEVKAVQDVSLKIEKGAFVAIKGPSGSGKTTLMNIMGLLDRPNSGEYLLDHQEVNMLSVDELARLRNRKVGFVFQSFHLLPRTTALENVELPLIYSDRTHISQLAAKALKAVGLDDRMDHFSSELSGGQQQRVAIARALVNDPEIIFADEPTGNLDSQSGLELMALFQELHRQGRTIVLITHDQAMAKHAQRIFHISDGKIIKEEKIENPKHANESYKKTNDTENQSRNRSEEINDEKKSDY